MEAKVPKKKIKLIDDLVSYFISHKNQFSVLIDSLHSNIEHSSTLQSLIHSTKSRIKDPSHLKDKLLRKLEIASKAKVQFDYNQTNLFSKINDLAGFRILHLHTKQFQMIDAELKKIFSDQQWKIVEGPDARTWDDETREYFESIDVATSKNSNMYTSVHYIISPNTSAAISCEIQVRTLMEEVWGEVDHSINYPHKSESLSCREQIKTLARVTSSCSRLVDSIFATNEDEKARANKLPLVKSTKQKEQKAASGKKKK